MKLMKLCFSLICLLLTFCNAQSHKIDKSPNCIVPSIGMPAPQFTLKTNEGNKISLSDYKGKIVLLNFWAFWCDTWKEEKAGFSELHKRLPENGFQILCVAIDPTYQEVAKTALQLGEVFYPVLIDEKSRLRDLYQIDAVPTIFLIDQEGIIRYKYRGYPGNQVLINKIRFLNRKTDAQASNSLNKSFKPKIALTFDDFPQPFFSDRLLDILKDYGVRATFFIIGQDAKPRPQLLRRASREGHLLGIHGYSHSDLSKLSEAEVRRELQRTRDLILKATGNPPRFFRPPGGWKNEKVEKIAKELGLSIVLWTTNSGDYHRPSVKAIQERVLGNARHGAIMLLHDGVSDTISALPGIITELRQRNFEFVTLSELMP